MNSDRIEVKVKLFASFREAVGVSQTALEVEPGATVGEVWTRFVEQHPRLQPLSRSAAFAINGRYAQPGAVLSAGDVVAFLPPVSGG